MLKGVIRKIVCAFAWLVFETGPSPGTSFLEVFPPRGKIS